GSPSLVTGTSSAPPRAVATHCACVSASLLERVAILIGRVPGSLAAPAARLEIAYLSFGLLVRLGADVEAEELACGMHAGRPVAVGRGALEPQRRLVQDPARDRARQLLD